MKYNAVKIKIQTFNIDRGKRNKGTPSPINQEIGGKCKTIIANKEINKIAVIRIKKLANTRAVTFLVPSKGKYRKVFLAISRKLKLVSKQAKEKDKGFILKAKNNKEKRRENILKRIRILRIKRILLKRKP